MTAHENDRKEEANQEDRQTEATKKKKTRRNGAVAACSFHLKMMTVTVTVEWILLQVGLLLLI